MSKFAPGFQLCSPILLLSCGMKQTLMSVSVYVCVCMYSVFVVSVNDSCEKGLNLRLGSTRTQRLGVGRVSRWPKAMLHVTTACQTVFVLKPFSNSSSFIILNHSNHLFLERYGLFTTHPKVLASSNLLMSVNLLAWHFSSRHLL